MIPPPPILLVEDSDSDAELTILALQNANVANPIVRVEDGAEALDYLHGSAESGSTPPRALPSVILLDINLPRVSGHDVLKAIRNDERTTLLPVVILTSSAEDRDRFTAYQHRANSYVQKPVSYQQFMESVRQLGLYWLVMNMPSPQN